MLTMMTKLQLKILGRQILDLGLESLIFELMFMYMICFFFFFFL